MDAGQILDCLLASRLGVEAHSWLTAAVRQGAAGQRTALALAFSAAARRCGRAPLALTAAESEIFSKEFPGVDASTWTVDQIARLRLVLAWPAGEPAPFLAMLDDLFAAAAVEEAVALYQGLALLPHPAHLRERAAIGIRSSLTPLLEAVALGNPYPAAWLDEEPFCQMVLKCAFNGLALERIVGLDRRACPRMGGMLTGFIRERLAAKRVVADDVWAVAARVADAAVIGRLRTTSTWKS